MKRDFSPCYLDSFAILTRHYGICSFTKLYSIFLPCQPSFIKLNIKLIWCQFLILPYKRQLIADLNMLCISKLYSGVSLAFTPTVFCMVVSSVKNYIYALKILWRKLHVETTAKSLVCSLFCYRPFKECASVVILLNLLTSPCHFLSDGTTFIRMWLIFLLTCDVATRLCCSVQHSFSQYFIFSYHQLLTQWVF